jgi:hypothetical protein
MENKLVIEKYMNLINKAYDRCWWWQAQTFGFADGI